MPEARWQNADRISDRIVDLLNEEIAKSGLGPLEILAGQCLALHSFMDTAPMQQPPEFKDLRLCVTRVLKEIATVLMPDRPKP